MKIIGREPELQLLKELLNSNKPEFLAIYGRRRVGKTFLIKNFFCQNSEVLFFSSTGLKEGSIEDQIVNFTKQIGDIFYNSAQLQTGKNWSETFEQLTHSISNQSKNKKIVLFFDEFPWMVSKKSKLLQILDYYWNQHWSNNPRIKLIICGSAASWIINNIISNKGGLHNRITSKIYLEPFTLKETSLFLAKQGVKLKLSHVLKIYMALGGIPYYLTQIKPGLSAIEIITKLFFNKKSILRQEFDNLFSSLFDDAEKYKSIVQELAKKPYGIGQRELLTLIGKSETGGSGLKKLRDLESTGFIMSFKPFGHKRQGIYYRLVDEYCLFYLKWVLHLDSSLQSLSLNNNNWQSIEQESGWHSWLGYSFEIVCYKHLSQIRATLKMPPTAIATSWRYVPRIGSINEGAQIDLLFDRTDDSITICEIKYSEKSYILNKQDITSLQKKIQAFKTQTNTKKQIFVAFICAGGIQNDYYADTIIDKKVILEDLIT